MNVPNGRMRLTWEKIPTIHVVAARVPIRTGQNGCPPNLDTRQNVAMLTGNVRLDACATVGFLYSSRGGRKRMLQWLCAAADLMQRSCRVSAEKVPFTAIHQPL